MLLRLLLPAMLAAMTLLYNGCSSDLQAPEPSSSNKGLGFDAGGWRIWQKDANPNWLGQTFGSDYMASDPTVIFDGVNYRMYYTCLASADDPADTDGFTAGFCQVKSTDGKSWNFGPTVDPFFSGVILRGAAANWDTNMETASIIKNGSAYQLFYSGYKTPTDPATDARPPSAIGMATSNDGDVFTRAGAPILNPTPQGRDADDMFSPVAFLVNGVMNMIYVGWCVDGYHDGKSCTQGQAVQLLGATRASGGAWSKVSASVQLPTTNPSWLTEGAAEPAVLIGPDGYTYLFITGGLGSEPRVTGLARSLGNFGPWELSPEPILKPTGAGKFDSCGTFAPSVMLENNIVRMWYLGLDDCDGTCTSCDYTACGCEGKYGIGYAEAEWPLRSQ